VPVLPWAARWGYVKHSRKVGEFAEAIGAVVIDPEGGCGRAVIGAVKVVPVVIEDACILFRGAIGRHSPRASTPRPPTHYWRRRA
jgi:aerobic carbon-monoxide dehydrogenase medium subunit